jgi:hypothetical protein
VDLSHKKHKGRRKLEKENNKMKEVWKMGGSLVLFNRVFYNPSLPLDTIKLNRLVEGVTVQPEVILI